MVLAVAFLTTAVMFYYGVAYLNECPIKPIIPVYMIIGGGVGMVKIGALWFKHRRIRREQSSDDALTDRNPSTNLPTSTVVNSSAYTSTATEAIELALAAFLIVWFAIGNWWILTIYRPPYSQSPYSDYPRRWCSKQLYEFAITHLVIGHLLIGSVVAASLLSLFYASCCYSCIQS